VALGRRLLPEVGRSDQSFPSNARRL
jgi:hypothetical protein